MAISWKNPPPVVVIGGTEDFLVRREIKSALLTAQTSGLRTEYASTDSDVVDILTAAGTFGDPCLIHVNIKDIEPETVKELKANPIDRTGLLLECEGEISSKKYPILDGIHGAFIREHKRPEKQGERVKLGVRFLMHECSTLLGNKEALSEKLAEAIVKVVGVELGVLAFEALKFCSYAKHHELTEITSAIVMSLLRQSDDLDLESLRLALKTRDPGKLALSLYRIKQKSGSTDPTMLLLRGRGGPADLAFQWLLVKKLKTSGKTTTEISSRTGISEWILKQDIIPTIQNWSEQKIKKLLFDLSDCERSIFIGGPSPWIACETALLNSVSQ